MYIHQRQILKNWKLDFEAPSVKNSAKSIEAVRNIEKALIEDDIDHVMLLILSNVFNQSLHIRIEADELYTYMKTKKRK